MSQAPLRIAVVDDDLAVRTSFRRLLRTRLYKVDVFDSGAAFFWSLNGELPSCLLLDITMPGMTGFEVLSLLRTHGANIPTIMMTGNDNGEFDEISRFMGVQTVLRKPIPADELFAAIEAAVKSEAS